MSEIQTTTDEASSAEALHRPDISLRNQRHNLYVRERGVMFVVTGIYLYSAFFDSIFVVAVLSMGQWSSRWLAVTAACVIAVTCVVAVVKMWRAKPTHIWIVALPCAINLLVMIVMGAFLNLVFASYLLAAVLCYVLHRTWVSQSELLERSASLRDDAFDVGTA
jgi:hypothetical protein